MSVPDFGKGSPEERGSRRLALAIGAVLVALIVGAVVYALVG